jgi:hypothetical protein
MNARFCAGIRQKLHMMLCARPPTYQFHTPRRDLEL